MGKTRIIDRLNLLHGGDYNPEQWLDMPEILEQDIERFKTAGINTVSVGIFAWAMLEPEEGKYNFDWLEKVIDRLWANGISVILATPTGARPKWMADKYPEVLRVSADGHRNFFGARHNHCYTSPVYREKMRQINTELARRFDKHPAVVLWHISNEYGGECHCPLCQQAFRDWLKVRYGTIEALNKAWSTIFWSHVYNSFDQIESPSPRGENELHGLKLDWKRFVTDQTKDFVDAEIAAIRDAGAEKPATINMMYDFQGLNYHKLADSIDIISWDTYPLWHKYPDAKVASDTAMQHDIMRSLKKEPFLLMESCPSAPNWQGVSKLKKPGMLEAASLQAVAHGSDSVLYFQMRQSRGSFEKFHGAVIDHYGGADTRVLKEVGQVGSDLQKLQEVRGAQTVSEAAVVFDWENRWAMEDAAGPRNKGMHYKETVQKSYDAFRKMGLNVDLIDMEQSLEEYKIVAAPMVYLFRAGFEEKVRAFVEKGGIFVMTYWSGIVDETDLCFLGGTPHGLMDVFGLRSTEIDGLYDWECNHAAAAQESPFTKTYICKNLCDLVKPTTAKTLLKYQEDFYQGMPALTENTYEKGTAYYICADLEQDFYNDFYRMLAEKAGLAAPVKWEIPAGVEVSTRQNQEAQYLFVQNFNAEAVKIPLQEETGEALLGEKADQIPGYGTVVLKRKSLA